MHPVIAQAIAAERARELHARRLRRWSARRLRRSRHLWLVMRFPRGGHGPAMLPAARPLRGQRAA